MTEKISKVIAICALAAVIVLAVGYINLNSKVASLNTQVNPTPTPTVTPILLQILSVSFYTTEKNVTGDYFIELQLSTIPDGRSITSYTVNGVNYPYQLYVGYTAQTTLQYAWVNGATYNISVTAQLYTAINSETATTETATYTATAPTA